MNMALYRRNEDPSGGVFEKESRFWESDENSSIKINLLVYEFWITVVPSHVQNDFLMLTSLFFFFPLEKTTIKNYGINFRPGIRGYLIVQFAQLYLP